MHERSCVIVFGRNSLGMLWTVCLCGNLSVDQALPLTKFAWLTEQAYLVPFSSYVKAMKFTVSMKDRGTFRIKR
jgi:hypothetical protein